MRRGQVFVRAVDAAGRWAAADVLDLDDESFRAFVLGMLFRWGLCAGLRDEHAGGEVTLRLRPGLLHDAEEP